jgi:hypothetical protein
LERSNWHIADFFYTYINGFIYNDVERCIKAEANHVVALALLSYTEFIGGLISGNLGKKGHAEENFGRALEYFPEEYRKIDSSIQLQYFDRGKPITHPTGIYNIFRCGLVHEYFIKGHVLIHNNPDGHADEHIGILRKEHIIEFPAEIGLPPYPSIYLEFHANEFFRDFKSAVAKILKLLLMDKDKKLLEGFNESLDRISSRRIVVGTT